MLILFILYDYVPFLPIRTTDQPNTYQIVNQ